MRRKGGRGSGGCGKDAVALLICSSSSSASEENGAKGRRRRAAFEAATRGHVNPVDQKKRFAWFEKSWINVFDSPVIYSFISNIFRVVALAYPAFVRWEARARQLARALLKASASRPASTSGFDWECPILLLFLLLLLLFLLILSFLFLFTSF